MMRALAALLAIASLGCVAAAPATAPSRTVQLPGPKLLASATEVARQYACSSRSQPLFVLEQSVISPTPLAAGEEFDHRIVYALCPARANQDVAGKLRTRIRLAGAVIVDDTADYRIRPGRWAVDTFIALPPHATPGAYEVDLEFTSAQLRFATKAPFSVWVR